MDASAQFFSPLEIAEAASGGADWQAVSRAGQDNCSELCKHFQDKIGKKLGHRVGIGWSLGGMVLLEAAGRLPGLFDSLVLFGTTAKVISSSDYLCGASLEDFQAIRKGLEANSEEQIAEFFKLSAFPSRVRVREVHEVLEAVRCYSRKQFVIGLDYLESADLRQVVQEIKIPVLLVHGEEDKVFSKSSSEFLLQALPSAQLTLVPKAGHSLYLNCPPEVVSICRDFITVHASSKLC